MILLVGEIEERGIELISLDININTSSAIGKMIFRLFATVAEYQRAYILESAAEGRKAAKARGRSGGRPFKLKEEQLSAAITLAKSQRPVKEICSVFGISRATFYRKIYPPSQLE
jgi:DNA invertase Pin-like site-specific DNA recombinase